MSATAIGLDFDVIVIGSGFGGSVAALRFSQAGESVCVLERGDWLTRETFEADFDISWNPRRDAFGLNEIKPRGRSVVTWTASGVGGGSLAYAGALFRVERFDGFPSQITPEEMDPYYSRVEHMLAATPYPSYEPYGSVPIVELMLRAGDSVCSSAPNLVESHGPINLGISFAPPGVKPGHQFTNSFGASQRYSDPTEHGLLGGDIDSKNSLDRNYLFLAQRANTPAEIKALHEVDRIERFEGGYRVHFRRYTRDVRGFQRWRRRWLPGGLPPNYQSDSLAARRVVIAAGSLGSTELLLRNRDVHKTIVPLSDQIGSRYSTNGDYLMLMLPYRRAIVAWASLMPTLILLIMGLYLPATVALLLYYGSLVALGRPTLPDLGSNNSTYIRFKGVKGEPQGAYIQCGRYPTPGKALGAALLSALGAYRPRAYSVMSNVGRWLQLLVPPFGAIAHSWPIAMLTMGRDEALGRMTLDQSSRITINYDLKSNARFYGHLRRLGRLVASASSSLWMPHVILLLLRRIEVPHNQGGVPMGKTPADGVVDHAGRVFGWPDLIVLDGSILPRSPGPNPALTIAAIAERAMEHILQQAAKGPVSAVQGEE